MALEQNLVLMGITDLKFTPDGGEPIDIYAVRKMSIDLEGAAKSAEGDDKVIAYRSVYKGAKISFEAMAVSMSTLQAITGQAVVSSGTSPNQEVKVSFKAGPAPMGVLEGKVTIIASNSTNVLPQAVSFRIPRFSFTAGDVKISGQIEDVWVVNGGGYAVPDSNNIILEITFKESDV